MRTIALLALLGTCGPPPDTAEPGPAEPGPSTRDDTDGVEPQDSEVSASSEPVEAAPGCNPGPGQCCREDGTLIDACGPIGRGGPPGCNSSACPGPDGRCVRCRCLASDTRIATPDGERPVSEIVEGSVVWTSDGAGRRAPARVIRVIRVPVPDDHPMLRVTLADGRALRLSAGHPLGDGRSPELLVRGDGLDGSAVLTVKRVPYEGSATHDLLPEGPTGTYWANGILTGSTLFRAPAN